MSNGLLADNVDTTLASLQGAAKKMTQHLKCDNSVTLEFFCAKFCVLV